MKLAQRAECANLNLCQVSRRCYAILVLDRDLNYTMFLEVGVMYR